MLLEICSKVKYCSNVAQSAKKCLGVLKIQNSAPNSKKCLKGAQRNRERPNNNDNKETADTLTYKTLKK